MAIVKRIGPGSAFKVGFVVYALLGLIIGVVCAVALLAGSTFLAELHKPFVGVVGAVLCLILGPICYGLLGAIFWAIAAFFYNLAAGWVGGLKVETQ